MIITLICNRNSVLEKVAQTTEYTADKMVDDEGAYERVRTLDENEPELLHFWNDARVAVAKKLTGVLSGEDMYASESDTEPDSTGSIYKLDLSVTSSFNNALMPAMLQSLFLYFVYAITAMWYVYSNKGDVETYTMRANAKLDELKHMAYHKSEPTRPTYD